MCRLTFNHTLADTRLDSGLNVRAQRYIRYVLTLQWAYKLQSNGIRYWYTGRWWVGCYIWYTEEAGPGRAAAPPCPIIAVPNVTADSSTASVPTSI